MPYVPDFLLNMTSTASNLVDDSPEFRRTEQETQKKNLTSAANQAMKQIRERTDAMNTQNDMMTNQTELKSQPVENPITNPNLFTEEDKQRMSPAVPPPEEFNIQLSQEQAPPPMPPGGEDPVQSVHHIAQTLGLTVQQVAAIAMLGQDVRSDQESQLAQQNIMQQRQPVPPPTPPGPMPPTLGPPPGPPPPPTASPPTVMPPVPPPVLGPPGVAPPVSPLPMAQ